MQPPIHDGSHGVANHGAFHAMETYNHLGKSAQLLLMSDVAYGMECTTDSLMPVHVSSIVQH